jgi:hypothetical protein
MIWIRIFLLTLLLGFGACDNNSDGITPNAHSYRSTDTLQFWEYKAPPPGVVAHRNIMFSAVSDSLEWSNWIDDMGGIHLYYGDRWEIAYTGQTDFESLNAPEWYTYYDSANYAQANTPHPPYWGNGVVSMMLYDPPRMILLARRKSAPYPVFALQPLTGAIMPMAANPNTYYQIHTILCKTYY